MRYIIGLLLGIGLIVLTFILIFRAFSGGDDQPQAQVINLNDYATSSAVMRYTIDGPETAESTHNRIRITVSKDQVLYEQIQGYEGKLAQTQVYPSNVQAYATFLKALSRNNYALGDKKAGDDERGYCPLGRRYIYEAINGGDTVFRWWSISCEAGIGSFRGKPDTVRTLFQRQVPDFDKLAGVVKY